jgi:hypothetical protein
MIVMYPNEVIVLNISSDSFCKEAIRFSVGIPCRLIKGNFSRMVMEKRPKNRICSQNELAWVVPTATGRKLT